MNKSLKLLLAINSLFVLAGNLLGPLYAVFIEGLGGSIAVISGTWSVMLLSTTLVNFIIIRYGDSIREHEYLLIAGYLLRAIAWIGFIFADNITAVIALQVIIGAGEAVGSTGFDTIFAEHLDRGRHVREYAIWKTLANVLSAVAVFVGGIIAAAYGFTPLFFIMAVVALGCAIYTYLLPRASL